MDSWTYAFVDKLKALRHWSLASSLMIGKCLLILAAKSPPGQSEDPESRRLRTVKNIADLRQNLEETMSSLRHMADISHRLCLS
ncbi:hypothetical protein NFI96_001353 [Prochilodus magdalenae]|nr:hypothetical protein NFI96_001353 [Prochilodus magdalenae]